MVSMAFAILPVLDRRPLMPAAVLQKNARSPLQDALAFVHRTIGSSFGRLRAACRMRLNALSRLSSPLRHDRAGQVDGPHIAGHARRRAAGHGPVVRNLSAAYELIARAGLTHARPAYAIPASRSATARSRSPRRPALSLPFGTLLRFKKDIDIEQPRVLVVAPLSGHFATLLRSTVRTLLPDHDVYITDWHNARDVRSTPAASASTTTSTTSSSSWRSWVRARTSWPSASLACRRSPPSP